MSRREVEEAAKLDKSRLEWYARVRKRNIGVFLGFFGLAASIYAFTIYQVGQEKFLDGEFDRKTS
jgi:hypothetical protein